MLIGAARIVIEHGGLGPGRARDDVSERIELWFPSADTGKTDCLGSGCSTSGRGCPLVGIGEGGAHIEEQARGEDRAEGDREHDRELIELCLEEQNEVA